MTNDQQFRRSPKQVMRYYYILEVLELIVSLIFMVALVFLWSHYNWWHFLIYIFIAIIIFDVIYMLLRPWLKYKYTFYCVKDHYIEIKKGLFFKKYEIIKFERTQFLKRKSNPLLRQLHISKLTLMTAGHSLDFPLMLTKEIEVFEHNILEYLRGADYDV
ncbi:PH domain-containing protein [Staphylococcus cohnii]|uniref:PH domain-containing protein n=1 Tax=Staphylococcus cohnii TaxID=29382 RepID=UPI0011A167E7|nr:PH domain-containing protein [Staphylococcus cohnii]